MKEHHYTVVIEYSSRIYEHPIAVYVKRHKEEFAFHGKTLAPLLKRAMLHIQKTEEDEE